MPQRRLFVSDSFPVLQEAFVRSPASSRMLFSALISGAPLPRPGTDILGCTLTPSPTSPGLLPAAPSRKKGGVPSHPRLLLLL